MTKDHNDSMHNAEQRGPMRQQPSRDVLVEFSMTPLDKGPSVSRYVARSLEIVAESGLDHRLGPMGTCIEGTWEECFSVIQACFEAMREDCDRISTSIKVDYRKDRQGRLESKIASVQAKVDRPIRT